MTPRAISLTRIIIAESLRDPHCGRGFCEDHVKHMNDLAEIFQEWSDSGKAQIDDPLAAAKLFNALIFRDAQLNALIGFAPERRLAAQEPMEWRLRRFFAQFAMRGYRKGVVWGRRVAVWLAQYGGRILITQTKER